MDKIKLDKIIFDDKITDFYVDSHKMKVYMHPHTILEGEKEIKNKGSYILGVVVFSPIISDLPENFGYTNVFLEILMFLGTFCLGLSVSYFRVGHILRKQTVNKKFFEIKNSKILDIAFTAVKRNSKGYTIMTFFLLGFTLLCGAASMLIQGSKGRGGFLFCSLVGVFIIGFVIYPTLMIRKSFNTLKKIRGEW